MRWLLIIIAFGRALVAQTGSVEGRVTDSITHAPIAGVLVRIDGPSRAQTLSGANGLYRATELAPGRYNLSFRAAKYSEIPGISRTPVAVVIGSDVVRLDMEMKPLAKLRGRVLDAEGGPIDGARILLLRFPIGTGNIGQTDQQGWFAFENVEPGITILLATPKASKPRDTTDGERLALLPTYFPSATRRDQAEPIHIRAGAELTGLEIRLHSAAVYHIRGAVLDEAGRPAPGLTVQISGLNEPLDLQSPSISDEHGAFQFSNIRPGEWVLSAAAKSGELKLKATALATVSRRNLENIGLHLARPFAVEGVIDRDDAPDSQGERTITVVRLFQAATSRLETWASHEQDRTLRIENVYPGRYEVRPDARTEGWYLDSVKLGEREVLGQQFDLFDGSVPLRVTYRNDGARVRGVVEKGSGARIALLPLEDGLRGLQLDFVVPCGADGRFEIGNVRPGDYMAFAFDRVEPFALRDAAFVRTLARHAVKVHAERSGVVDTQLKVTAWPE